MRTKATIILVVAVLLVLSVIGCMIFSLPRGSASCIEFSDGWSIGASEFVYINEHTVKIIRRQDGQVFYVPANAIERIWVAE